MPAVQITTISRLQITFLICMLSIVGSQAPTSLNLKPRQTVITTRLSRQESNQDSVGSGEGSLSRYCQHNAKHQILTLHDL